MYACICAAATTQHVRAAILAGACTVEDIGDRCGAGTGCGSCVERLECLLGQRSAQPAELEDLPRIA
ncbi:(2Fe-2S)-binding protein [Haloechinothrix sp. LS1_15]|uniref:(2Fe-2S)-binding protein n=1 Tax=Haloechinothrix sp. LS1_15 TaxID=2652248 RepID=UPI002947BB10|nr:(2Fe-2S)-binding protein [Haloechinothrix sp. LS1_15]MDV6012395.1 (2Fe-2S)-binding protein [Haloechinothrix sp. LS1_15]